MSEWPSSLKSPVPIAFQLGPGLAVTGPPPMSLFPSTSQIAACPSAFCNRISEVSPLKNAPAPLSNQAAPGFGPSNSAAESVEPFNCHSASCPPAFCKMIFKSGLGTGGSAEGTLTDAWLVASADVLTPSLTDQVIVRLEFVAWGEA